MMPRDVWARFESTVWMKALKKRIDADHKMTPLEEKTGTVIDIFPSIDKLCTKDFEHKKTDHCYIGIQDSKISGMIVTEPIVDGNLEKLLEDTSGNPWAPFLWKSIQDERYNRLENPGVEVVVVYANYLPTAKQIFYKANPKKKTIKGRSYDPDQVINSSGDGTVTTGSAIIPAIKWAHEFSVGGQGAKPVKFVEMCSIVNKRKDIFEDSEERKIEKNGYMGVKCDTKEDGCGHLNHNGMLKNHHFLEFVLNSVLVEDGAVGETKRGFLGKFEKMSYYEWEMYESNCKLLNP